MTRSLAFVFLTAPAFVLAWLAMPHSPYANVAGLLAVCACAWVCGGLLFVIPPRLAPDWMLKVTVAGCTVLVSLAVYFSVASDAGFGLFYLWSVPYAYFFFSVRHAAVQTLWVAVCFPAAMILQKEIPGSAGSFAAYDEPAKWLILIGTIALVGALVRRLANSLRRSDEANRHAALHDALTALPNRTLAMDRIAAALERMRRDGSSTAVLILDLDRFKVINDSLGHAVGDELLLALAPRLAAAVGDRHTIARLGGDEFVVVCPDLDGQDGAAAVAQRLDRAVREPIVLTSGEHFISGSIGIAMARRSGETPQSLLRDADAAMYRVKARGRGGYEVFDDRMRQQTLARLRIETDLRHALQDDQLRVHYQPVIEVRSGRTVSVEALVRWNHPERGAVAPGDFISVAEETGLIAELGIWVLAEACRQVAAWQQQFGIPLGVCVNVSGRQIANPLFPSHAAEIARSSGLANGTLGLEITESVLIEEAESPTAVVAELAEHDLRLILDDFGTGYSSLSYLKRFPVDTIKVDRTFVAGLGTDADDSAIVEAIIGMAQALGMDVIAEGVETAEQLEHLRALGCPHVQGYLFARPLSAENLTSHLRQCLARDADGASLVGTRADPR
jgi:diguanylate cyclase (GGDEF)-like protein